MAEVLEFTGMTRLDIPPEKILKGVATMKPRHVFIISEDDDGELHYFCSSADCGRMLLYIKKIENRIVDGA